MRDERFLQLALKIAAKSQHRFPIGAIIVRGNRILSVGINKYRTHPKQINPNTGKIGGSIHAELDAILSCDNTQGTTLYVARLMSNGEKGLAKPCSICQKIIEAAKIKKVVYTDNNQQFSSYFVL